MTSDETVRFIDSFVKSNMSYLNNISLARLEFLSLWLQSHPDTSTMNSQDRDALCLLLHCLASSNFYTDEARSCWNEIAQSLKSYSLDTASGLL